MQNEPLPPIPEPHSTPAITPASAPRRIALWRWWAHLLIIGSYPIAATLSARVRVPHNAAREVILPASVRGLFVLGAIEVVSIGLFWLVAWAFSRATKDELWLRWRGGIGPIWQGALYSIGLRLLPILPFIAIAIVLAALGVDAKAVTAWVQQHKPQTEGFGTAMRAGSAAYQLTMLTFFSFVVAGLREELWRVATMRGLLEVAPRGWSNGLKSGVAIVISACVFGFGHLYQGLLGAALTAVIGIALGAITLRHRCIWPAVIAHGCFDAASFLLVSLGADKLAK